MSRSIIKDTSKSSRQDHLNRRTMLTGVTTSVLALKLPGIKQETQAAIPFLLAPFVAAGTGEFFPALVTSVIKSFQLYNIGRGFFETDGDKLAREGQAVLTQIFADQETIVKRFENLPQIIIQQINEGFMFNKARQVSSYLQNANQALAQALLISDLKQRNARLMPHVTEVSSIVSQMTRFDNPTMLPTVVAGGHVLKALAKTSGGTDLTRNVINSIFHSTVNPYVLEYGPKSLPILIRSLHAERVDAEKVARSSTVLTGMTVVKPSREQTVEARKAEVYINLNADGKLKTTRIIQDPGRKYTASEPVPSEFQVPNGAWHFPYYADEDDLQVFPCLRGDKRQSYALPRAANNKLSLTTELEIVANDRTKCVRTTVEKAQKRLPELPSLIEAAEKLNGALRTFLET